MSTVAVPSVQERTQLLGHLVVRAAARYGVSMSDLRRELAEPPGDSEPCPLSTRELECLQGLAEGKCYKEIGAELGLAASTIRSHLHTAYLALGVRDRAQAVLLSERRGWLVGA